MKDLLTGEELIPKKSSQKFATPANRIKYNNWKASLERQQNAKLDKPLRLNKRILDELLFEKDEAQFSQDFLLGKGFNYAVSNRIQKYEGINYYCIYEYIIINDNKVKTTKIIRDDRY